MKRENRNQGRDPAYLPTETVVGQLEDMAKNVETVSLIDLQLEFEKPGITIGVIAQEDELP